MSLPEHASLFFNYIDFKIWLLDLKVSKPQQWEASTLTNAHAPFPVLAFVHLIVSLRTLVFCIFVFLFCSSPKTDTTESLGASCHSRNGPSSGCSSGGLSLPQGNLVPFWASPSEYIKCRFSNKGSNKKCHFI